MDLTEEQRRRLAIVVRYRVARNPDGGLPSSERSACTSAGTYRNPNAKPRLLMFGTRTTAGYRCGSIDQ